MNYKKILVTGAAGFIGFHVIRKLSKIEKYQVIGIDNINDYYDVQLKFARLEAIGFSKENIECNQLQKSSKYSNCFFAKQDISDYQTLFQLFQSHYFDIVIHLAAQAGVRYSLENPHAYIQSNVVGFTNILECCRRSQTEHLVYASSSSVYGNSNKVPFSEEDRVDFPVSLYAATKKSNELMAYTYSYLYHIPTTGLRFFTVYGPWGRPDMSPIIFAKAIAEKKPIKIFNEGNMLRDFTYIDDIIESIYRVMQQPPNEDSYKPYYNLYNIGNSTPIHLMDFIRSLENALGMEAIKEYHPMQPGDVYRTYADSSKLQRDISYKPSTTIEEGVQQFAQWYKNQEIITLKQKR